MHCSNIYGSPIGVLEVGIPGPAGFSMKFESADKVLAYLPAHGTLGALDADVMNPTNFTTSGAFGGEVVALKLNIDFSGAGHIRGLAGKVIGDFRLCGTPLTGLNGSDVRGILAVASSALGGGPAPPKITDLNCRLFEINVAVNTGVRM